ncbi:MAG: DoxX protein [Aureispira sp.]|nr:DoxX protein [Aureispira sp.]
MEILFSKETWRSIVQIMLALILIGGGVVGLMIIYSGDPLLKIPQESAFIQTLLQTPHVFVPIKIIEIISGFCLISKWKVPFILIILGPIVFNILTFHIFEEPAGLPLAIVISILYSSLVYSNRSIYLKLWQS